MKTKVIKTIANVLVSGIILCLLVDDVRNATKVRKINEKKYGGDLVVAVDPKAKEASIYLNLDASPEDIVDLDEITFRVIGRKVTTKAVEVRENEA